MIARQFLERKRVLLQAERTADLIDHELQTGTTTFRTSDGLEASADELRRVRNELRAALKKERSIDMEGSHSAEAFLPRSRILSNLQSLTANRATINAPLQPQAIAATGEAVAFEAGSALLMVTGGSDRLDEDPIESSDPITGFSVADQLDDALEPIAISANSEGILPVQPYSEDDPLWLTIGLAFAWREAEAFLEGERSFNAAPAKGELGPRSRLFLFGDWGSGIERARKVAGAVAAKLGEPESQNRDCHVIHLGDTYFAGWPWEQVLHVIHHWPVRNNLEATSWALPGNHDYYSGGDGFFQWLLSDPRFAHQRSDDGAPTSVFELGNEHWLILGLDSSYKDHDLPDSEIDWLRNNLEAAHESCRRVILLSHHQPWSVFTDGPNPPLWKKAKALWSKLMALITGKRERQLLWKRVRPLLTDHPVEAWFWGHEHRLALYKKRDEITKPRLLGNAGVPSRLTDATYVRDQSQLLLDYEEPLGITPDQAPWCRFAFAMIDLDPDGLTEQYFDEDGEPIDIPSGM